MAKETDGQRLDRWKHEGEANATEELHKVDRLFPNLPVELRGAIFQGMINCHRCGHAKGRKEIGK